MWHLQHPEGPREINELHVPVDVPVKLTMTSQDVIHDFYIPAFRVKKDVLPGRYTSLWFQADRNRHVSSFLRAILRHQPRRNDRLGLRDVARRITPRGSRAARRTNRWRSRASSCSRTTAASTATLADGTGRGPSLAGHVWQARKTRERRDARGGRSSDPPGDSGAQLRARAQLPADHAHVSGPIDRRADA